jgi:hypothetical protein
MESDTSGAEPDNKCPAVSPHPWKDLRISRAPKKRGRPKGKDKSLFIVFHGRRQGGATKRVRNEKNVKPRKRLRTENVSKCLIHPNNTYNNCTVFLTFV